MSVIDTAGVESRGPVENRSPASLVDVLRSRTVQTPEQVLHIYLPDGEQPGPDRTYAGLDHQARKIAALLQEHQAAGKCVLLFYPPGPEFLDAFFGCLYAGAIAVPAFPPDPSRLELTIARLKALIAGSRPVAALTTNLVLSFMKAGLPPDPVIGSVTWLATDTIADEYAAGWKVHLPAPDSIAYLQYTSGSTRLPRGVSLTQANLVHNAMGISRAFDLSSQDIGVIWLPMYHNLGLIGGMLQPFFAGFTCYILSPQTFLQKPLAWLKAISRYRGTVAGGPNFAFDLCVQRMMMEPVQDLDLSSWTVAFNGAEAVRPETIERFTRVFEPFGFKRSAFYPCYGLAEATLMVTGGKRGAGPRILQVSAEELEKNRVQLAQPAAPVSPAAPLKSLVGCGKVFPDQELRIVDPEACVILPDGLIGEIWVRGPSVAPGYWGQPDESSETFNGYLAGDSKKTYLRTGDLGFLQDGECFITGRLKELIIIRGRNLYPQDIERTVEQCHPALIPNANAAFSIEIEGEERLAITQEVGPKAGGQDEGLDFTQITAAMRQAVSSTHGVQLFAVLLVEPGSVPKTISGKVQRQLCRRLFQAHLAGQALSGPGVPQIKILHASVLAAPARETDQSQSAPADTAGQPVRRASASPERAQQGLLSAALSALGPERARALLEQQLCAQVSRALDLSQDAVEQALKSDPNQPLSGLGIDSISSIEIVQNIEAMVGVTISLESVVQGISLGGLVNLILEKMQGPASREAAPVPAAPLESGQPTSEYPLTYGQRALWFVQRLNPDSVAHNIVYAVTLLGDVSAEAVFKSMQQIVLRHPILRTRFIEVDGQPVQRVYPGGDHFTFKIEDARNWTSGQLEERLDQEVFTPFDLANGPLMRVTLFVRGPREILMVPALHHIVTDMWSMAIMLNEFGLFYAQAARGITPRLKEITTTYEDEVRWQEEMIHGPAGESHLAYWRERLAGDLQVLNLPTDYPHPAETNAHAEARSLRVSAKLTAAIKKLARQRDSSLFSVLLAAFDTLLYRYTGQTDLLVGTPKAGRSRRNALIFGYFINPAIIRTRLDPEMPFSHLVDQVYQNVQADFQHDEYPFPLLVERLQPTRSLGYNPLLQVFFSWQKTTRLVDSRTMTAFALNESNIPLDLNGLQAATYQLKARVTPTDLGLMVAEADDDLEMTIEYSTDLFKAETIERMLSHLHTLLESVATDPELPVCRIPILTPAEQKRILVDWNAQPTPSPDRQAEESGNGLPIHRLIELQAGRTPDAVALEGWALRRSSGQIERSRRLVSYQELVAQAHSLAVRLQDMNVGPGQVVGLCASRSPDAVIGLLGILFAGAAYLPLDPDYPADRLAYMIADARAAAVVTHSWLAAGLPGAVPRICLDQDLTQASAASALTSQHPGPEDVAYVLYTSGSTGRPKGVLVSHAAIARHCQYMRDHFQMTSQDRVLQFASLNFDASLEQIFTALLSGARLVIREDELWDPGQFTAKIAEYQLTVVNVPPAYWDRWVAEESRREDPIAGASGATALESPYSHLRLVIVGGDVMLPQTLQAWQKTGFSSARLINAYGPTEAIITATAYDVPRPASAPGTPDGAPDRIPIGRPLAGRTAYILDPFQQPVPQGIPGELYLGGECLALGYLGRPDLTAEKFVAYPFAGDPRLGTSVPQRLYRTGDLASFTEQGDILFHGRSDRQMKILGIRIEPGEIEAALKQHPQVADAVVLMTPQPSSRLAACLILQEKSAFQASSTDPQAEISRFLSSRLPQYMIPAEMAVFDAFPLTPSGKLDRTALAEACAAQHGSTAAGQSSSYTPPRNEMEEFLACMWAELLGREKVGVHDNFFALGGHSLLAAQIMSRVRGHYGVDVPLRSLFELPTIANLSLAITQALAAQEDEQELESLLNEIEETDNPD